MEIGRSYASFMPNSPITKAYLTASVITTAACHMNVVHPMVLYFDVDLILQGQLWRIVTNFLFFGSVGFNTVMQMVRGFSHVYPFLR
jgi:Derlin-2/3